MDPLTLPNTLVSRDLDLKEGLMKQYERTLESKGKTLTLMCVGESGVGKTTLISNIFTVPVSRLPAAPTKAITDNIMKIDCDGIPLTIHFIDTPGYGDELELLRSFNAIADEIDNRYEHAFAVENALHRPDFHQRIDVLGVDAVLYFIAPHRFKGIDLEFLKVIQGRTSIIPILAKADTMTEEELSAFRSLVTTKLADAKIKYYRGPFAVISAPVYLENVTTPEGESSKLNSGRKYPWGVAESENEKHSQLPALRRCLVLDGLSDLQASTQEFYEEFRCKKLRYKRGLIGILRRIGVSVAQALLLSRLMIRFQGGGEQSAITSNTNPRYSPRFEDEKDGRNQKKGWGR